MPWPCCLISGCLRVEHVLLHLRLPLLLGLPRDLLRLLMRLRLYEPRGAAIPRPYVRPSVRSGIDCRYIRTCVKSVPLECIIQNMMSSANHDGAHTLNGIIYSRSLWEMDITQFPAKCTSRYIYLKPNGPGQGFQRKTSPGQVFRRENIILKSITSWDRLYGGV